MRRLPGVRVLRSSCGRLKDRQDCPLTPDRIARLKRGEQFRHLRLCRRVGDQLGGAAADFQPAGVHRGQLARQTIEKLYPVEARQTDAGPERRGPRRGSRAGPLRRSCRWNSRGNPHPGIGQGPRRSSRAPSDSAEPPE